MPYLEHYETLIRDELTEEDWNPVEFDESAPYFRAYAEFGAEPEGDFFFDLDEAIDEFQEYWEGIHQVLYDVNGLRLAAEGPYDEELAARMDDFATWALNPY
jgi:hypothetical protein